MILTERRALVATPLPPPSSSARHPGSSHIICIWECMNALIEKLPNHCASTTAVVYEMVFHNSEHSYVVLYLIFSICQIVFNTSHSTKLNTEHYWWSTVNVFTFITKNESKTTKFFIVYVKRNLPLISSQ